MKLKDTDRVTMAYLTAAITYAGFDPLFMLHHMQIDRLWAVAQRKIEDTATTTWTTQTALEVLEESADFG